MIAVKN